MLVSFLSLFCLLPGILCADLSSPISPAAYRDVIKQGFSTNWFKTAEPLSKYHDKNIEDIYKKGFRNVRLRSRADLYSPPYNTSSIEFSRFLGNLAAVVDKCLQTGVAPIISWIHHKAEANATEEARRNYVAWWTAVANHLKHKNYGLSFNLFTELGLDYDCGSCNESLRVRTDKYNRWTSDVVKAIRGTGGKNKRRILILGSPGKTGKDLHKIDEEIYTNDSFMLAEWHVYASGPNKKEGGQKYWSGNGSGKRGQANVEDAIAKATQFTKEKNLLTYLGAWMPTDNKAGSLTQKEVINFARFFVKKLKEKQIPWSLNVLDRYYDTETSQWITKKQDVAGRMLDMKKVLNNIIDEM